MKTRKSNKAKHICTSCSNNGTCPYCTSSRTHSNRKRQPTDSIRREALVEAHKWAKELLGED